MSPRIESLRPIDRSQDWSRVLIPVTGCSLVRALRSARAWYTGTSSMRGMVPPPPCTGKMGHRAELLPAVRLTTPTTPHPVRMSRYGINKQWFWILPWPREAAQI